MQPEQPHAGVRDKQCVLYWKEKGDTVSSHFIWSISLAFSLSSVALSHILPLPGSSKECTSVLDPRSGAPHTHLSADVTADRRAEWLHTRLCMRASYYTLNARVPIRSLMWGHACWILRNRRAAAVHWALATIYVRSVKATEPPLCAMLNSPGLSASASGVIRGPACSWSDAVWKKKKKLPDTLLTQKPRSLFEATVWRNVMMSRCQSE